MPITFVTTSAQHLHTHKRHPERTERIQVILDVIRQDALLAAQWVTAQEAPMTAITRIHDSAYVQSLADACAGLPSDYVAYADTYTTQATYLAACQAAGAACQAADLMMTGHAAFALCRPPGHHATAAEAMGFCFFNNIAIAARHLQAEHGLRRIAIVDIDVHHGNGTQEAFYADDSVLFVSSHASPLYPFSGEVYEMGIDAGHGSTLNIPVPAHTGDAAMHRVYQHVVIPALVRFRPECILVSAGFDAHWDDPVGNCRLSVVGYQRIFEILCDTADHLCGGRIMAVLEGGYSLRALPACVQAAGHVLARTGGARTDALGSQPSDPHRADAVIARLQHIHPLLQPQRSSP